jgi:hypothetical protein
MASELAQTIKKTIDDEGYVLQEVRDVLIQTADRNILPHGPCWCRKDLTDDNEPHSKFCLRARTLWAKLEVK